ncbi:nucleoside-diphosphate kinase [Spirochaetia bacterium]|nr:nucleoside-diphosphate kinase [Spirochaetia bacterium]
MLKPGVLHRRIVGEIISRFEKKGLKIVALKVMRIDPATAEAHYAEHRGKAFYRDLTSYISSGPVAAFVLEGEEVINTVRRLIGKTDVKDAVPGSIRGDFAYTTMFNVVHASDSLANAEREIGIFFRSDEICEWEDGNADWL